MKGTHTSSLVLCLSLSFTSIGLGNVDFMNADLAEVRTMAAKEGKMYFVYFSASWCLPCQWMEKNTFTDSGLSDYVKGTYLAVKIDVDEQQGFAVQQQFEVTMLPSILIFNSQGVLVGRSEESLNAEQLVAILYKHDLPRNRIQTHPEGTGEVLESPKPHLSLHRPALVPDAEYPAEASLPPAQSTASIHTPAYRLASPGAATKLPVTQVYAPRSDRRFGIQVGSYSDYSNAVRRVNQLEAQFSQPVSLVAHQQSDKMTYKIILGIFQDRASAEDYLSRLRQNSVDGFVKEIGKSK